MWFFSCKADYVSNETIEIGKLIPYITFSRQSGPTLMDTFFNIRKKYDKTTHNTEKYVYI